MKVALLANSRFPIRAPFAGGLESFTWNLARKFRRLGTDVVLVAAPGSDPDLHAEELLVVPTGISAQARLDVAMPSEYQVADTIAYLQVMQLMRERDDIDLIHNNSLHYLPIALSGEVPQPVLTTLHCPPTPWLEPALALTPGAHTTAVSGAVARMWEHVTDAKVILNGIDLDTWAYGDGGESLVWVGRIVPEKAPHLAIAVAQQTNHSLRLVGPVHDRPYFDAHIAPHLDDRIVHVGHLTPTALQSLVSNSAACLVTPAWDEPYGLVAAEAMATGTPVLAIARGGLAELVRQPAGMGVPVGADDAETVANLSNALESVLALNRREVHEFARAHCSLAASAEQYLHHYEELLAP